MSNCPACFGAFVPEYASWVCTSGACTPELDPVATRVAGYDIAKTTITNHKKPPGERDWDSAVACRQCGTMTASRVCPYCHFGPLPNDWMTANTTCVAMTGARDSGKSVYIAVAAQQLRLLGHNSGVAVDFADDVTRKEFVEKYERPLFEQRGMLRATAATKTTPSMPLIFSMGLVNGRRQYLILRDIAGEELENTDELGDHLRFLTNAHCVLFMFDPAKVTTVADLLQDLVPEQRKGVGDPHTVLNNVLRLIGNGTTRLAIVLAKFDTMELLQKVQGDSWNRVMSHTGSAMLRDPSLGRLGYDEADGALLDQEVRSLLLRLNAGGLINALERPTNGNVLAHRYFAVSALGEFALRDRVSDRGIKPFRCLDPLKWALRMSGAI